MSNMDWVWWKDWWRVKRLRKRLRHAFDAREQQQAAENAEGTPPSKHCRVCNKALPDISGFAEAVRPCRRCRRRHFAANTAAACGSAVECSAATANKPDDYENNGYCFEDHPDEEEDEECGAHNDVPLGVGFDDVNYYYGEDDDGSYDNVEDDDFCYCDECWNGDGESNDGMDSDCSTCSNPGKQVVVGICAMAKKTQSKPMKEILTRLQEFEFIKMLIFSEDVILKEPVENWPLCDCLISFHSKGFPLEKAIQYAQLRKPYVLNNLHMQYDIQDRRRVYAILEKEGIEIPRYAVLDRDSPDPKQHELIESEDHVEVNGIIFNKPFVEKPVSAEDHNIYIYYPTSAGGGSQRLFRKVLLTIVRMGKASLLHTHLYLQIGSRSSVYSPESRVRKTGSFIYEDFMPTDGTDVKVYTVGPDYAHAEARKSPALDGKVERDSEGKEIRYPVILNNAEKLISRKVCLAFKQTVCGFDLLRANGKSYVCDVNGFSFVKNSNKYYDDCAKILGNMILRELTPTLHIPWLVPFQLDDPPIVPTTFGKMMELRCVVAVIRHGDRTPKQKMKLEVRHPKFFEIFEKYDGYKDGHVKLKRPKQLQEILDIARYLLSEIQNKSADAEIQEKESKLEQLKNVLEMYGHFSGINRKVQMKYQPKGRPRGSSSDDVDAPKEPSLVLILKWGGELTPAGRIQAEELGRIFRCMYPGGQGRQDYSGTQGLGLLRLHSTFRHDLKIYASDEGRVQMTAAAFAKGLLALEGELTPILVQMVKSANTNGLLDNDCDSSKYQNLAKQRLHDLMRVDREFTMEDREVINPCNSISINQALDFVKNPVECCNHVHKLIKELLTIISVKKEDPKTKDAILYHGETWDLMARRWEKIEKDFSTKSKQYDISKVPDIYDCIKYDLQHNQHTLQYDQAEELYIYAKYLADIVIPQEYGSTVQEKLAIGQGICTPLLKKIKADLQRNIEEVGDESVNRLNPHYSHGVASPGRHVRTRLYFTSESHVHSLLTVLRYGGLLNVLNDEQWRRAMDYISMVSELNYMSQVVIMLYEDPTKDPTSEERFHVELHFSPGVNCCVQKNLPPGPGFRPHSRNDSGNPKQMGSSNSFLKTTSAVDDANPPRIEEENDSEDSPVRSQSDGYDKDSPPHTKHQKSKPIPIGAHHTVSGHEAAHLAKRLNEELASQQHSLESQRPISPDAEPRSRSYEQRDQKRAKDGNATPVSSSSSVSSRRQRHSIAGQMSYMKMLGFGGFSKKMATSSSSLFSTAVISGSSSAPNLRDMIPCAVSSSVLEGFGGVPPIRPLETLHNALSLKQLDQFLHKMTTSPLYKTPASSPPKHPSTPQQTLQGALQSMCSLEAATSYLSGDSMCQCQEAAATQGERVREPILKNAICMHPTVNLAGNDRRPLEQVATEVATAEVVAATATSERANKCNIAGVAEANATATAQPTTGMWSQQSSVASSTEPSSPAISDTYSHETPSGEMSISITSAEGSVNILPVAEELAKFFPQLDDEDLNAVSVYTPMNTDALEVDADGVFTFGAGSSRGDVSACLTPVSFGMDISMIANKGSMTLSVDGFEDDDETTLSAATTPSLPVDEPKLETCYCCPTHAEMAEPPDVEDTFDTLPEPLKIPDTKIISSSPETNYFGEPTSLPPLPLCGENTLRRGARKATDPISPKIKKQISLFEGGEYERQKEYNNLHASINIPSASTLKQDARLRKFETLTQSTSNSNFPFASNTLKRVQHNASELDDVSHTQSCINLKSSVCASPAASATGSPQHKATPIAIVTQPIATTCTTVTAHGAAVGTESVGPPRPGALIVKERFIEPPKRIPRSFHSKTQSMDADFLFNEFLLVPARSPTHAPISPEGSSRTSSASTSPAARSNSRFMATKILDDMATLQHK
ncbi:inositol hexakisphosphate and diphosphoinositol-pentakisphosphate kinase isoform X18 [Bactrocera neohumeralis]|uniref:inositol hexakisphosphate and diphosphoinositol-pentakisphosphate kinase isoform X18 n=1 Tax=Bactrocera neohumeralis TaxID=98809 RepID=UPI0021655C0C|nr:inositol hexakisphosphate and diphosphoinositol-pentakisphosphate kinase isoform X18 [Bactrocera neohumeralis]